MKISILMALCDDAGAISETLACIRAQQHEDWELVVAESGRSGGADRLARDFARTANRTVRFSDVAGVRGTALARNCLMGSAAGELFAFLDTGDLWAPNHLANALPSFAKGADVVVSDVRTPGRAPGHRARGIATPAQLITNPIRTLFSRNAIATPSCVVFRRDLAAKAGPFDPRFRGEEGRDFWLRCAVIDARFAATRCATCVSTAQRTEGGRGGALATMEQTVEFYEKHRNLPTVPAALRRRLLAASLTAYGRMLRAYDPARAARCFWRAWSLQPVQVQTLGQIALTGWSSSSAGTLRATKATESAEASDS